MSLMKRLFKSKLQELINTIKAADKPEHEAFVLIAAKSKEFKQYVYKLYSNAEEIEFPANWMNAVCG